MSKKPIGNNFLTIKEFADLVGMKVSTLRYYDRIGIFCPIKYGVGFENKYRYYAPTQITTVKMINVLTAIGVPLKLIKELAENRTPEKIIKLLFESKAKIADKIGFFQDVLDVISIFIDLLNEGISVSTANITVRKMPEKHIILGDENHFEENDSFYGEFIRFRTAPHEPALNMSYPVGAFWPSMEAFTSKPSHPTRFYSLDPNGQTVREAGLYLNGYTHGYYGYTGDLAKRMTAFAHDNGLDFTGAVYAIYLFDELSVTDPEQYMVQISASVKETRNVPARNNHRYL